MTFIIDVQLLYIFQMSRVTLADAEAYIKRYEPEETQVPGYLSVKGLDINSLNVFINELVFPVLNKVSIMS